MSSRRRLITDPEVDAYAEARSSAPSDTLRSIARTTVDWSDKPGMMIDATEARLLSILVALTAARRILEVGTFTGYSGAAMLEALAPDGHLDTLEMSETHADKAAEHFAAMGMSERVTIHRGPALQTLEQLQGPYDLAFIDAEKVEYPRYYEAVLGLMRPGGLIVADNVLRAGRVIDEDTPDVDAQAMRRFNERAATDPRVETVLLAIRDGVSLIRVR